jgi:hypothetical protein
MTNYPAIRTSPVPLPTVPAVRRRAGLMALVMLYLFAAASARTPLAVALALLMLAAFAIRVRCRTRRCAEAGLTDRTSP